MSTIACLAWGSLVWEPRDLPVKEGWFPDGPLLHVEFARHSSDGCITLVLHESAQPVQSLWAILNTGELSVAREALRIRERISPENETTQIGTWSIGDPTPALIKDLDSWAKARGVQHVIWTALPAKFEDSDEKPSEEQILNYLSKLEGPLRIDAELYIRRTHPQIKTAYRKRIEEVLQWMPIDN